MTRERHPYAAPATARRISDRIVPGSLVKSDDAGKCRKTAQECGISGELVQELDMRSETGDHDEFDGSGTHHLIAMLTSPLSDSAFQADKSFIRSRPHLCGDFPPRVKPVNSATVLTAI